METIATSPTEIKTWDSLASKWLPNNLICNIPSTTTSPIWDNTPTWTLGSKWASSCTRGCQLWSTLSKWWPSRAMEWTKTSFIRPNPLQCLPKIAVIWLLIWTDNPKPTQSTCLTLRRTFPNQFWTFHSKFPRASAIVPGSKPSSCRVRVRFSWLKKNSNESLYINKLLVYKLILIS